MSTVIFFIITLIAGILFGFVTSALLSASSYENGFQDGYDACKEEIWKKYKVL